MTELISLAKTLNGGVLLPGDESISHRYGMRASTAGGTRSNELDGNDILIYGQSPSAVAALAARGDCKIEDAGAASVSFPEFYFALRRLAS